MKLNQDSIALESRTRSEGEVLLIEVLTAPILRGCQLTASH